VIGPARPEFAPEQGSTFVKKAVRTDREYVRTLEGTGDPDRASKVVTPRTGLRRGKRCLPGGSRCEPATSIALGDGTSAAKIANEADATSVSQVVLRSLQAPGYGRDASDIAESAVDPKPPRELLAYPTVNAPQPPAVAERQAFPDEEEFRAWLGEESTTALIFESHGRYHAFCVEFGIAGSGATKEEAVADAAGLLIHYLIVCFSEERSYREAKKAPPFNLRLRSWYLYLRTKVRGIKPLSRLGWLTSVPTINRDSQRLAH
jgi:hypothetical protein